MNAETPGAMKLWTRAQSKLTIFFLMIVNMTASLTKAAGTEASKMAHSGWKMGMMMTSKTARVTCSMNHTIMLVLVFPVAWRMLSPIAEYTVTTWLKAKGTTYCPAGAQNEPAKPTRRGAPIARMTVNKTSMKKLI